MKTPIRFLTNLLALLALSTLNPQLSTCFAQGTAFTYQGRLNDGANQANGIYDLRFTIYDSAGAGTLIAGPLTNSAAGVSNGLFTVTLDFGNQFPGANRWLEIGVRTNGNGAFTTLSPRQPLTPSPYAITAGNVTGTVAAGQVSGTIALAQLPAIVVTNNQSGLHLTGSFAGDGVGVTNVPLGNINSGGAVSWPGIFALSSTPAVGSHPICVVAADVNGDGKLDLTTANYYTNTLSVLTNNGSGGFVLASSPIVGGSPYASPSSVVAMDVNGDGKVDLINANLGEGTLSVLTNNGNGGFVRAYTLGVGGAPYAVVTADVNGDGRLDLICANSYDNTLSVLTNNGSGGFVLASTPAVGTNPVSVAVADVNGDGKPDLISANAQGNTLSVLINTGNGGFVLASNLVVGNEPFSVAAADVNGDGKVDLICANVNSGTLSVLTNTGNGGFVLASSPAVGGGPDSVIAADLNGDGKVDLICALGSMDKLAVLTNDGSGGFVLASTPAVGSDPSFITAADVNGDGAQDLICANYFDDTLSVLLSTPMFSGNFPPDVPRLNASQTFTGADTLNNPANVFAGNGSGLTSLNANNLSSGTLADARLSTNVALLNRDGQTFTGGQAFYNVIYLNSTNGFHQTSVGNFYIDAPFIVGGRFTVLANGNTGIGTNSPQQKLHVIGGALFSSGAAGANQNVLWTPGSASWSFTSDRNTKERIEPVNPQSVLERLARLRIAEWSYIGYDQRHIGPMAQDFHAQFPLNGDDKALNDADLHGVALAAIQGLNQKLEETREELKHRDAGNAELKQRLAVLEKIVLSQKSN